MISLLLTQLVFHIRQGELCLKQSIYARHMLVFQFRQGELCLKQAVIIRPSEGRIIYQFHVRVIAWKPNFNKKCV